MKIVDILGVGGFLVDFLFYCDTRLASQLLELVSSDILRPMTIYSFWGAKYFLSFFC